MKILVTGSRGFIAKNLIQQLEQLQGIDVVGLSSKKSLKSIECLISSFDFIFHLAGVNRPKNDELFKLNNDMTIELVNALEKYSCNAPILFSSSQQVELDNSYGKSKLSAENILLAYSERNAVPVYIFRLPGVFGKWAKPNYNSVIATWCYNVSRGLPIKIDDPTKKLELVYIDDLVNKFISILTRINNYSEVSSSFVKLDSSYNISLLEIANLLNDFQLKRSQSTVPESESGFSRALYATYLSYLPTDQFESYLLQHEDQRGSFYEVIKTNNSGQISISTTMPGSTVRGNHYHNTKNEKFVVVSGQAKINMRCLDTNRTVSFNVSSENVSVVDMIPGYTHNIINISETQELILLIWASEIFDPDEPDTYYLEV